MMKIIQISAGRDRSVALSSDGTAYAWGGVKLLGATLPPGYPGELCTSNATEIGHNRYAQPVPQKLNPGMPFSSIADGYVDTLAVRRNGQVLSCRPVVSSDKGVQREPLAGLPAAAVQVTLTESGGFALYADGSVWSWGMRAHGQLGRAAVRLFEAPAAIAGLVPITALAAGHGHMLALDRSGHVWAWGANGAGQLGRGTLQDSATPVRLDLPVRIRRIAAGDTHSLAVDDAGRLWGWGANNFGQTGEQSAKYNSKPTRIATAFAAAQIDAGMFYSVATSVQGDVFAWGWNGMGQLGRDAAALSAKPLRVATLANVSRLCAGAGHVLALNDRGVFAWGDNRASACGAFPSIAVQVQPLAIPLA